MDRIIDGVHVHCAQLLSEEGCWAEPAFVAITRGNVSGSKHVENHLSTGVGPRVLVQNNGTNASRKNAGSAESPPASSEHRMVPKNYAPRRLRAAQCCCQPRQLRFPAELHVLHARLDAVCRLFLVAYRCSIYHSRIKRNKLHTTLTAEVALPLIVSRREFQEPVCVCVLSRNYNAHVSSTVVPIKKLHLYKDWLLFRTAALACTEGLLPAAPCRRQTPAKERLQRWRPSIILEPSIVSPRWVV